MLWTRADFISETDVGIAYRKVKADLYYERGHPNVLALCEYEENLEANLKRLYERLHGDDFGWTQEAIFLGKWSIIPKSLNPPQEHQSKTAGFWWPSDPDKAWQARIKSSAEKPKAEFRLVGIHPIDFHIVSTLWMLKVGHLYDGVLGPEACGSRLRRYQPVAGGNQVGEVNPLSLGTFQPYLWAFRQWRENGLATMRRTLDEGKKVIAITADIRQFYHRLSPDFLAHPDYLGTVGLTKAFDADQNRFTQVFLEMLHAWAALTPLHKNSPTVGIPVGLPASRLVANVALVQLDHTIRRELAPLYYGRYVDDVLLVIEDTRDFDGPPAVWDHIV